MPAICTFTVRRWHLLSSSRTTFMIYLEPMKTELLISRPTMGSEPLHNVQVRTTISAGIRSNDIFCFAWIGEPEDCIFLIYCPHMAAYPSSYLASVCADAQPFFSNVHDIRFPVLHLPTSPTTLKLYLDVIDMRKRAGTCATLNLWWVSLHRWMFHASRSARVAGTSYT